MEALPTVASSNDDHHVADEVRRVVPSRRRLLASRLDLLPPHLLNGAAHVQRPDVVERRTAIAAAEYPQLVLVENGRVRASRWRKRVRWKHGVCPFPHGGIEDIDVVVVRGTFSATEDDDLAVDERRCMRATWWWDVAYHVRVRPLHRF